MKNVYLILAIVGLILPNYFVVLESIETGNIMLYADPVATFSAMFANRISSIFAIDLLFGVVVFFLWSYHESKRLNIKKLGLVWLGTMLLGLASGLPFFLYLRAQKMEGEVERT